MPEDTLDEIPCSRYIVTLSQVHDDTEDKEMRCKDYKDAFVLVVYSLGKPIHDGKRLKPNLYLLPQSTCGVP